MLQISNKLVGSGGTTVKGVGIELSVILVKLVMWSVTIKQNRTTFNHCLIYSHKLIINDHALKAKSCWKKKTHVAIYSCHLLIQTFVRIFVPGPYKC